MYDGKYSIDETPLYLSSLWNIIFSMSTFSPKSVFQRLVANINDMGDWRLKKQSSIQFHIWKQCIREREENEMLLMCIMSAMLVFLVAMIDITISYSFAEQKRLFDMNIYFNPELLSQAHPDQI